MRPGGILDVAASAPGRVTAIAVSEGEVVRKDQLLLSLSTDQGSKNVPSLATAQLESLRSELAIIVRKQAENGAFGYLGGQRNYAYFWDFYDVWTHPPGDPMGWERNKVLNIFDINAVGARFGPGPLLSKAQALAQALVAPTDAGSYHPAYDRGPIIGANMWDRGPPDGSINIVDDILGIAQQFGHDCG